MFRDLYGAGRLAINSECRFFCLLCDSAQTAQALLCILHRHGGLEAADGHDSASPSFLDFWQGRTRARENGAPARSLQLLKDERRVGLIRPARRRLSY
jgi:hypothetical protein